MIKTNITNLGKYSKVLIEVVCDLCGIEKNIALKLYTSYGYYNGEYLCKSCKTKKNNLEKYGVENVFQLKEIKQKTKQTNLEKYGVESVSQNQTIKQTIKESKSKLDSNKINNKRKNTVLSKYGVDNISQLKEIKEKIVENNLIKYGVEYTSQLDSIKSKIIENNLGKYGFKFNLLDPEVKTKIKQTNLEKYGYDIPSKNLTVKNKIKESVTKTLNNKTLDNNENIKYIDSFNKTLNILCEYCKSEYLISYFLFYKRKETHTTLCTICNPIDKNQSGKEIALYNYIKSIYDGEIIQNYKLERKEIDIYIPQLKLGFEFNGVYWHSELYKENNYHLNKTIYFSNIGIRIIHIWEDDWDYKKDILKSQIENILKLNKVKIYARNCDIKLISDTKY